MKNSIAQIFGRVNPPPGIDPNTGGYGGAFSGSGGLTNFISNILKLLIVGAGVFALINLVMAGYGFMSAGGDAKKVADASAKIWQTFIGLAVAVGAFVLAALIGYILFSNPYALLQLSVFGP